MSLFSRFKETVSFVWNKKKHESPWKDENWQKTKINHLTECLHDKCPDCKGRGIKANGKPCPHYISCPCIECTPQYYYK